MIFSQNPLRLRMYWHSSQTIWGVDSCPGEKREFAKKNADSTSGCAVFQTSMRAQSKEDSGARQPITTVS